MNNFFNENSNEEFQINQVATNAISNFRSDLGRVNILIAGKTGVGKSTLINAIFKKDLAVTGEGTPITQDISEFTTVGFPISIIDTKGLELKDYQIILGDLKKYIIKRQHSEDMHSQIHAAWVCIAEGSSRIEVAEKELVEMLSDYMPVIIVITKLTFDQGLQNIIKRECPKAKDVIRVQSKSIPLDDGYVIKPKNLEELAVITNKYLPQSMEKAFISAQKVSLELKEEKAKDIIPVFMEIAAESKKENEFIATGVYMITVISGIFGLDLDKIFIIRISIIIFGDKNSKFKKIVNKVLRFVPGVKTKLTPKQKSDIMESIGNMYLSALVEAFDEKKGKKLTEIEAKTILYELVQKYFE